MNSDKRLAVYGVIGGILGAWVLVGTVVWALNATVADETSAQTANESTPAVMFTDDRGRQITLTGHPQRIVAGASFAVELLMALDHPPVLRPNVAEHRIHPPAARAIPSFPVEHGSGPDAERLAAARPDLVILHVNFSPFAANLEATLDVPVALLEITSVDDVLTKLELLGRVLGKPQVATERIATLQHQIDAVTREAQAVTVDRPGPRVLALFGTPDAFYAFRDTSYLGSLLMRLGAVNLAGEDAALGGMRSIAPLNLEQIVARSPETIVVVPHGPADAVRAYMAAHPAWERIAAVRDRRVYMLDEALFSSSPGPRAAEALDHLKGLLYPQTVTAASDTVTDHNVATP